MEILLSSFSDDMTGLDVHDSDSLSNIQTQVPIAAASPQPTAGSKRVGVLRQAAKSQH